MKELTRCLKAMSNERRLHILKILADRSPLAVGDIAAKIHLSHKSTSKHVQRLVACDLVKCRQESSKVQCSVNTQHVIFRALFSYLRRINF